MTCLDLRSRSCGYRRAGSESCVEQDPRYPHHGQKEGDDFGVARATGAPPAVGKGVRAGHDRVDGDVDDGQNGGVVVVVEPAVDGEAKRRQQQDLEGDEDQRHGGPAELDGQRPPALRRLAGRRPAQPATEDAHLDAGRQQVGEADQRARQREHDGQTERAQRLRHLRVTTANCSSTWSFGSVPWP